MKPRDVDLSAALTGKDTLTVKAKIGFWSGRSMWFRLYENGKEVAKLHAMNRAEIGDTYVFTLSAVYDFVPGRFYEIADCKNEFVPVDMTYLATTDEFDRRYRCDKPQGAVWTKEFTTFRLFSPLASLAKVRVKLPGSDEWVEHSMTREECGCFSVKLEGDYDGAKYTYIVFVNGRFSYAADPFGFGADTNSRCSYVINPDKVFTISDNRDSLTPLGSPSKAIIYECSVRDMTSKAKVADSGTFMALSRTGLTYGKELFPVGLDYIKALGVTHVQIQPVMDFQTVDEANPKDSYNWGYDPVLYFVPEGSYATDPEDPYSRIIELRTMVSAFHKENIRVNFDVVYNHVFDALTNPLERLCPGYYFRHTSDGNFSNGSFCGNDLESRRYMCKRLIIESLCHMVTWFGADGFRFDLMGIIDKHTMLEAQSKLLELNKDIMIYGEGWDMPTALPSEERSTLANAKLLPKIGFFSDIYRDVSKGGTSHDRLGEKGYLTGDVGKLDDFKFAYTGCCLNLNRNPIFDNPMQCISYVECHDNSVLWDKMKACCSNESDDTLLKRLKMINAALLLSCGIPFLHSGQEFGQSKNGNDNSFCAGDAVNGLDYDLACRRKDYIRFVSNLCHFRREHPEFTFKTREELMNDISFRNFGHGCVIITYTSESNGLYHVLINPDRKSVV